MAKISVKLRDLTKPVQVPTGELLIIEANQFDAGFLEMEDLSFHFDSAVLLPDQKCDGDPATPEEDRVTGLAVLRACLLHAQNNADQKLIVCGHTDTVGSAGFNLALSQLRAENVLFALTGERAAWIESTNKKHKVEDYQHILRWIAVTFGFDCDPQAIDDRDGPATQKAVHAFQKRFNVDFDAELTEDGIMGKQTWGAVFDMYTLELKALLDTDDAGLASLQGKIKFLDAKKKAVGCGENHPIKGAHGDRPGTSESESQVGPTTGQPTDVKGKDEFRSVTNRRVELLFFQPGHEPKLDCHPAAGKCKPELCEIHRGEHFQFERIDCEGINEVKKPLVFSIYVGSDTNDKALVIFDGGGTKFLEVLADKADLNVQGISVFEFEPSDLPDPFEARFREGEDESHVAGPCSPVALRNALLRGNTDEADALANPSTA